MGAAARRRRRKSHRAHETRRARCESVPAPAAADRIAQLAAPDAVTNIADLHVSIQDVDEAGTASAPLSWYIGRCRPMAEGKVLGALRERRIAGYIPVEKRWRWSRDRKRRSERPLFVGYIFIGLTPQQSIYHATRVSGLEGVVEAFGRPAQMEPWAVMQIAAAELAGAFDHTRPKQPAYATGQSVLVKSGQFAGFVARVVESKGDRVRILFEAGLFKGSPFAVNDSQIVAVTEKYVA